MTCSEQYAKLFDMSVERMLGKVGDEGNLNLVCEDDRTRYIQVTNAA